jgi:hypothetical protein
MKQPRVMATFLSNFINFSTKYAVSKYGWCIVGILRFQKWFVVCFGLSN